MVYVISEGFVQFLDFSPQWIQVLDQLVGLIQKGRWMRQTLLRRQKTIPFLLNTRHQTIRSLLRGYQTMKPLVRSECDGLDTRAARKLGQSLCLNIGHSLGALSRSKFCRHADRLA